MNSAKASIERQGQQSANPLLDRLISYRMKIIGKYFSIALSAVYGIATPYRGLSRAKRLYIATDIFDDYSYWKWRLVRSGSQSTINTTIDSYHMVRCVDPVFDATWLYHEVWLFATAQLLAMCFLSTIQKAQIVNFCLSIVDGVA